MLKVAKLTQENWQAELNKRKEQKPDVTAAVQEIINNVKLRGDAALLDYAFQFDGLKLNPKQLLVTKEEQQEALNRCEPQVIASLKKAYKRIYDFHLKQKQESWFIKKDGVLLGQKVTPIKRVGLYIPGGLASYPSTVLMNVVPAKIAGVQEIALTVPPSKSGQISKYTLAAASIAGVSEIYRVGGAQAVAALAYGTQTIKKVDKIAGPGNIYVATAKKLVVGDVGIDMIAGPTEVVVVADETAPAAFIAADMLAQAEHDPLATAILITTSDKVAQQVINKLKEFVLRSPRRSILEKSLQGNSAVYLVESLSLALAFVNQFAPEHLELLVKDAEKMLPQVENAGAIFLGPYTPEALGDYVAGPNHTLPTSGSARFYSPLGVYDFIKWSSVLAFNKEEMKAVAKEAMTLAEVEGLDNHKLAVAIRLGEEDA
jgi:histidinol dehydrogenase